MLGPSKRSKKSTLIYFLNPVFALVSISLTGCSSVSSLFEPEPPDPTVVQLKIETSSYLNANTDGIGTPIVARYYELKSSDAFNNADFFAIYNQDKDLLASDIVFRKELELTPDDSREIRLEPKSESRFIGVFGAFRDLETAQWRAVKEIPQNQTTIMQIHFSKNSVTIKIAKEEAPSE